MAIVLGVSANRQRADGQTQISKIYEIYKILEECTNGRTVIIPYANQSSHSSLVGATSTELTLALC